MKITGINVALMSTFQIRGCTAKKGLANKLQEWYSKGLTELKLLQFIQGINKTSAYHFMHTEGFACCTKCFKSCQKLLTLY